MYSFLFCLLKTGEKKLCNKQTSDITNSYFSYNFFIFQYFSKQKKKKLRFQYFQFESRLVLKFSQTPIYKQTIIN